VFAASARQGRDTLAPVTVRDATTVPRRVRDRNDTSVKEQPPKAATVFQIFSNIESFVV